MTTFAVLADLEKRYPGELIVLAANEQTGERDDVRIEEQLADASAEMRGILKGRYSAAELERLDADSRAMLRVLAMDITLYRVALSFARSSERLQLGYDNAIRRLTQIATGKAGLSFEDGGGDDPTSPASSASPNEVLIDAPADRMFSVRRMGRL